MNTKRILLLITLVAAAASPLAAQPAGPGPLGPGPLGFGPLGPPPGGSARSLGLVAGAPLGFDADDRADDLYNSGREAIEEGKYERALDRFNRLIELKSNRTDAALYWKAYSLAKLGRGAEAVTTLTDLQQRFKDSRWMR